MAARRLCYENQSVPNPASISDTTIQMDHNAVVLFTIDRGPALQPSYEPTHPTRCRFGSTRCSPETHPLAARISSIRASYLNLRPSPCAIIADVCSKTVAAVHIGTLDQKSPSMHILVIDYRWGSMVQIRLLEALG